MNFSNLDARMKKMLEVIAAQQQAMGLAENPHVLIYDPTQEGSREQVLEAALARGQEYFVLLPDNGRS